MALLELENLHVALEDGTPIVKGVDLEMDTNQVHAIMGPNGSGKSNPRVRADGSPGVRDHPGQDPPRRRRHHREWEPTSARNAGCSSRSSTRTRFRGVTVTSFLRSAINAIRKAKNGNVDDPIPIPEFRKGRCSPRMDRLKVSRELASRYVNDGFSGGEKKRAEILQMAMLQPRIAILDETDSGLDIDALRVVAGGVKRRRPESGRACDHPLPADPGLHQARLRARARRRPYRRIGRAGAGKAAGGGGYEFVQATMRRDGVMAQTETKIVEGIGSDYAIKYGFSVTEDYFFKSGRGLSHEVVDAISAHKNEPDWMRKFRLKSLEYFFARPMPEWGGNLGDIDFDNIFYYLKPTENQATPGRTCPRRSRTPRQAGDSRG